MELEEWKKMYVPIEDEVDRIPEDIDANRVWTLMSCDGQRDIVSGQCWINSLHYIITEKPYEGRCMLVIKVNRSDILCP